MPSAVPYNLGGTQGLSLQHTGHRCLADDELPLLIDWAETINIQKGDDEQWTDVGCMMKGLSKAGRAFALQAEEHCMLSRGISTLDLACCVLLTQG